VLSAFAADIVSEQRDPRMGHPCAPVPIGIFAGQVVFLTTHRARLTVRASRAGGWMGAVRLPEAD